MKGLSLVELLVATAVLALLAALGLTGLLRGNSLARDTALLLRLQERASYALGTLEADIQMAGYFGLSRPVADQAPLPASACGAQLPGDPGIAVQVLPTYTLACEATAGGAASQTPVLIIRRASVNPARPEPGRWQWFSRAGRAASGYAIVDGQLPGAVLPAPGASELRNLLVRAYYVARGSDADPQTPSLRVKSLASISGRPAFVDTEVMPGVEFLQVELLPDAQQPAFVQLQLTLRDEATERRATRSEAQQFTRRIALRNAPQPQ